MTTHLPQSSLRLRLLLSLAATPSPTADFASSPPPPRRERYTCKENTRIVIKRRGSQSPLSRWISRLVDEIRRVWMKGAKREDKG